MEVEAHSRGGARARARCPGRPPRRRLGRGSGRRPNSGGRGGIHAWPDDRGPIFGELRRQPQAGQPVCAQRRGDGHEATRVPATDDDGRAAVDEGGHLHRRLGQTGLAAGRDRTAELHEHEPGGLV